MNRKPLLIAALALSMAAAGPVRAEMDGDRSMDGLQIPQVYPAYPQQDRRGNANRAPVRQQDRAVQAPVVVQQAPAWGGNRGYQQGRNDRDVRWEGRGAGPGHQFRAGGRLPDSYRQPRYVVNDWQHRHLSAPPRGYHWVQTGSDYVLAAIATGLILQVFLGN